MSPVALYALHWTATLGALLVAWRSGGPPERQAALVLLSAYLFSIPASLISIDLVVIIDVVMAIGLLWLSLIHRRWWLLFVAANAVIIVLAHWSVIVDTGIYRRAYIAYRTAPGLIITVAMAVSPVERYLAGERAIQRWLATTRREGL